MEKETIINTLSNQYRYIYPAQTILDSFDIKDRILILFETLEEMQSHAGYWVKFKPVAGDYTKLFNNIIVLDSGFYGVMGYATIARLCSNDLTQQEKELNGKA